MTREEASRGLYLMCVAAGRGERNWLIYPDRLESIKIALEALREEPRNALWMEWNYPGDEHMYCSACQERYDREYLFLGGNSLPNYCPNCGAKMGNANAK